MLCNPNQSEDIFFDPAHETFEHALSQFATTVIDVNDFDINTFEEHVVQKPAAGSDVESTVSDSMAEPFKKSSDWSRLQTQGWVRKLRKKCACVTKYYYTNLEISPHQVSTIKQALRMSKLHILKKQRARAKFHS